MTSRWFSFFYRTARSGTAWLLCGSLSASLWAAEGVSLVREGQAVGTIVIPEFADDEVANAVEVFVHTVKRSTGATIPVVFGPAADQLPKDRPRLYVGSLPQMKEAGMEEEAMEPESYRFVTRGNAAYLLGKPVPKSDQTREVVASCPTLWGLNKVLEEELGVRWLWPGELGTYVPRKSELAIPVTDASYQPRLMIRRLRMPVKAAPDQVREEAWQWARNHQQGRREGYYFREAFVEWWDKYGLEHPDLFAELPDGRRQPYPKPRWVKLRLANPKVLDFIEKEYREAGAPKYWSICPNDGAGFDVSDITRAWDIPKQQALSDIAYARGANLTARYVRFWNLVYERLKEINPEVVLSTYAYSNYRYPPPKERPLTAKAIISIVDDLDAYDAWKGWSQYAYGMHLRPNWWHQGADAPYIPYRKTAKYLKFATENGMMGFDMDSLIGYWGTQGFNYYLVARLLTRPELSVEELMEEYASAFGAGAPKIREYLAYWEKYSEEVNSPINAGGAIRNVSSKYDDLVRAGKIPLSILAGAKYALPHLYTDRMLKPAFALLDEAQAAIGDSDPEATRRVAFLRRGLAQLQATRDQIALGESLKAKPDRKVYERFRTGAEALETLRDELTLEHVVWGDAQRRHENRYRVRIRPENFEAGEINLDGL